MSALRIGSPADASDAPLQGWPILADLPRIPPAVRLSDPYLDLAPNSGSRQMTAAAAADGPGGWRRRARVDPGAGRRGAAVVGPWSGAPRASVGAPTRSAEIRGWSEPMQRTCRRPPTGRERRGPVPSTGPTTAAPPSGTSPQNDGLRHSRSLHGCEKGARGWRGPLYTRFVSVLDRYGLALDPVTEPSRTTQTSV